MTSQERQSAVVRLEEGILLCLPLLAACLYLKYVRVAGPEDWLLRRVLAFHGEAVSGAVNAWHFYAADILLIIGGLAGAWALVATRFPSRPRVLAGFLLVETVMVGVLLACLTSEVIGRFPTWSLARDFLLVLRRDPALVSPGDYLPGSAVTRAGLLALAGLTPPLVLLWPRLSRPWWRFAAHPIGLLALAALLAALGIVIRSGWGTRYHHPLVIQIAREFLRGETGPAGEPLLTPEAMQARWQTIAYQGSDPPPSATKRAPGSLPVNVLLVVLETHAAQDYDLSDTLVWPRVARLLPHAIVARRHYASHASSGRADFTLLSSVYDQAAPNSLARDLEPHRPLPIDALPMRLRQADYVSRFYYPAKFTLPEEEWAVSYLGFDSVFAGSSDPVYEVPSPRLAAEVGMFQEVREWLRSRPPLAAPFLLTMRSLLGHDPLFDPREPAARAAPDSGSQTRARRGIAALEDSLIGTLLDELRVTELLQRTVVVIVGDHGVRFRDPRLKLGPHPDLSFRVPLLVYAPHRVHHRTTIEHPTSHVDLAPTILALLGLSAPGLFHQGVPLEQVPPDRAVFLLAEGFLGYDGVVEGDRCYTWNYVWGTAQLMAPCEAGQEGALEGQQAMAEVADLDARLRGLRDLQVWVRRYLLKSAGTDGD